MPSLLRTFILLLLAAPVLAQGPVTRAGVRAFEARQYTAARSRLSEAAAADGRDATAALYLGRLELMRGDAGAAARWLERAVELDPRSSAAHLFLGVAYGRQAARASKLRLPSLARRTRQAFETAVALDPSSVDARGALLQYYLVAPRIVGGSAAKAREQARAIARLSPLRGRLAEGAIAEAANDPAGAEAHYEAALRAAPDSAAPYLLLGGMRQRQKRYEEAVATYDRLLARRDEPAAHYQAGRALVLAGADLARAERELTHYLGLSPKETDPMLSSAHYYLGLLHEKRGEPGRARQEYLATLALEPGRPEARDGLKRVH